MQEICFSLFLSSSLFFVGGLFRGVTGKGDIPWQTALGFFATHFSLPCLVLSFLSLSFLSIISELFSLFFRTSYLNWNKCFFVCHVTFSYPALEAASLFCTKLDEVVGVLDSCRELEWEILFQLITLPFVLCKLVRWDRKGGRKEGGRVRGRLTPCKSFQSETSGVW